MLELLQDDRVQKLQRLAELQQGVKVLKTNIQNLADNDPEILEKLGTRLLGAQYFLQV